MSKFSLVLLLFIACLATPALAQDIMAQQGLPVGAVAPNFTAKNQAGKKIQLKDALKQGPVVLVFYRGQWCPYCNMYLSHLADSLSQITAKGAQVIAISPEVPANVAKTLQKTKATYDVIADEDGKIMAEYKVVYAVDTATQAQLKGYGLDLTKENGKNANHLPIPATYIIGKDDKIVYRQFDPNFKNRPSVAALIAALPAKSN